MNPSNRETIVFRGLSGIERYLHMKLFAHTLRSGLDDLMRCDAHTSIDHRLKKMFTTLTSFLESSLMNCAEPFTFCCFFPFLTFPTEKLGFGKLTINYAGHETRDFKSMLECNHFLACVVPLMKAVKARFSCCFPRMSLVFVVVVVDLLLPLLFEIRKYNFN